jgi:hypothetical protein
VLLRKSSMLMLEYIITWFRSHILYRANFLIAVFFKPICQFVHHFPCVCIEFELLFFIELLTFPNFHCLSYSFYMSNTLLIFIQIFFSSHSFICRFTIILQDRRSSSESAVRLFVVVENAVLLEVRFDRGRFGGVTCHGR